MVHNKDTRSVVSDSVGHLIEEPQPPPSTISPAYTPTPSDDETIAYVDNVANNFTHAYITSPSNGQQQPVQPFRTVFASLKLQLNDTIIVQNFPEDIQNVIRVTIATHWPKPIQKEEVLHAHDAEPLSIKLRGNPWLVLPQTTVALGDTIPAMRLIAAILDALARRGWLLTLTAGSSACMRQHKPTLIFRHQSQAPAAVEWCVLSVLHVGVRDTLRVIDAPLGLCQELAARLQEAGMSKRYGRTFEGVYDMELGRHRCTTDNVDVQQFMLIMLGALDMFGFTVAASIDQSCDTGKPDTWYCCRPVSWEVGMPVFHR